MSFLSRDYLRTDIRQPPQLYRGLDAWLFSLVNWVNQGPGPVGEHLARARLVDERAAAWKDLRERTLRSRLLEFRQAFRRRRQAEELVLPTRWRPSARRPSATWACAPTPSSWPVPWPCTAAAWRKCRPAKERP